MIRKAVKIENKLYNDDVVVIKDEFADSFFILAKQFCMILSTLMKAKAMDCSHFERKLV